MKRQLLIETFPRQTAFAKAALSGRYSYLLYGGAIRGGKTVVVLSLIFVLARVFPGSRWVLVRKDLPTIKRNLLPAFNKFKPDFVGEVNRSDWTATCANGSQIIFMPESYRDDPEGHRFRGLEVNGFVLEEANELQETTFIRCQERMGTWIISGLKHQPPALILLTCNPARGWVKERFYDPWRAGVLAPPYFYLPARADDNPYISEVQKERWKDLPEREYRRFVLGDWDVSDDPDQLIRSDWLLQAYDVEHVPGRWSMGIDVARYGDDDTVYAMMDGNALVALESYHGQDIQRTAQVAAAYMQRHSIGADRVAVDAVGLGAGVVDALRSMGYDVLEIVSGASAVGDGDQVRFRNLRAQMWWTLRESMRQGRLRLGIRHRKLVEDLLSVRYRITGDRVVEIESKEQIKKRTGRSTDYGDALVYAHFAEHIPRKSKETEVILL